MRPLSPLSFLSSLSSLSSLFLLLAACSARPAEISVFAAASLRESFTEIARGFETTHPGTRVSLNFAGSQQLAEQIAQGAPADVFAAAAEKPMQAAVRSARIAPDAARVFARNRLVVVLPAANPAAITALTDLAQPGVKLVLANPSVPAGAYALTFLEKASAQPEFGPNFAPSVLSNVVSYEEDVRAAFAKVTLGEADAGIVYATDAAGSTDVRILEIPPALNVTAAYPIALLADSPNTALARAFVDYVLSQEGQATLAKYGFAAP